ncbi:MAG: hypothetical protein ACI808_000348 [Paraglaciecola sp.]|jgi:uncharacterized protein (DUF885 family)
MKLILLSALLSTVVGLGGCQTQSVNEQPQVVDAVFSEQDLRDESTKLASVLDNYFVESLEMDPVYATFVGEYKYNDKFSPPITPINLAKGLAFEHRYLSAIEGINKAKLSGQDLLSYEIFLRDRKIAIEGDKFPGHLIPLHQMGGAHTYFAALGSGSSAQPFNTAEDYRNFIKRADGFAVYMDSSIIAMREGAQKNIVLPKPLIAKVLPQLLTHLVDDITTSVFYGPLKNLDDNQTIDSSEKAAIKATYMKMISEVIIPSYSRVYHFMRDEYAPMGRGSVGLSALPNGKSWYEYRIETNTTLPLSADELHTFGKQEVARILAEMTKVKETVGFSGDLAAFFEFLRTDEQFFFDSEESLIRGYTEVKDKINQRLPMLFEVFPKADYEVRPVEAFRAASSAGASYQGPAPDGSRPGIFYINAFNLKAQPKYLMETLSIHEASPGHHFQITIQQEVEGLPKFRKFGGFTVFAEGWALYAESLGKELGLFTDPYMWYGRLSDEQLRAMRLVVDTGLHAFGWTRQRAIDFMRDNSSLALSDIEAEVERYIVMPGQAVSYKVGERHIRMLRNRAAMALGERFDVKKFHTQVLIDGALPMPILEAKIDRWILSQKAEFVSE